MDNIKKLKTTRNLLVLLVVLAMSNNAWAQSNNIGQRGEANCKYEWWGKSGTDFNQNGGYAYYVKEEPYDPNDSANPKITDVIGWHNINNTGDDTSANSHMVKVGGNVNIRNVYGGYSTNGDANNNATIVDSGTFSGNVVGGYAHSNATAQGNKVTINGGNYIDDANEKAISGGQGKIATGNEVIINGGTIACEVNGGTGMENNGIVSGNTVTINGGTMNKIFGGNIGDKSYNITATNNTVNILTAISVTQLSGGLGNILSTGNTLNLGATGITVGDDGVTHFQTIAVTKDVILTEGATVLSAKKFLNAVGTNFSDTLNLTNAVGLSSGASGTMTLLASETANNFSNLKLAYNTATQKTPVPITTEGVIYSSREVVNGNENTFYSNENKVALTNDNKNVTFTTVYPHISYTDKTNAEAGEVTLYAQPAVGDTDAGYKVDTDENNNVMLSLVDGFKKLTIAGSTWDTVNNNGTLGINMPKTGINTLVFQETDNSGQYIDGRTFRVYDDGGKSENYSNDGDGTLVITAPEGYIINVKSNSIALKQSDYLEIFDNNAASGTMLGAAYDGSAIDYTSTGNQMTLHIVSESSTADNNAAGLDLTVTFVHLVALPSNLGNNATVTYFKSATMPTVSDISTFNTPLVWANAGDWIVAHIVPNDGYWTDGQLMMAMETTSTSAAPTRGPAIDAPRALALLQADEYDAGDGTMKPRHDGAGWYYYQIPADHSFNNGYISSTIDVTLFDKVDLSAATIDGKTVTATTGDWTATITVDENAWTYDGVPHAPGISSFSLSNGTNTFTNTAEQVSISGSETNVGSYTASLTAVAYGCLANSLRGIDFSIRKASLKITAKRQNVKYGTDIAQGTDQVTMEGLLSGHTLTAVTLTASTSNVTTAGTITPSDAIVKSGETDVTGNYDISYMDGSLIINASDAASAVVMANDRTYDGTASDLVTVESVTNGKTGTAADLVFYESATSTTPLTAVPQGKDVGNYDVYYEVTPDANHMAPARAHVTVIISKKEIGLTWGTTDSWTYDGSAHAPSVDIKSDDIASGDVCNLIVTLSAKTGSSLTTNNEAENVGEYIATVTAIDNENYQLPTSGTAKDFSITANNDAVFDVSLAETEFTYDGTAKTPGVTVKDGSTTLIKDQDYIVSYSDNINAGENTAKVTVRGIGNYAGSLALKPFVIKKVQLTITADDKTKKAGEADPPLTYVVDGLVAGDALSGALIREQGEDAGDYVITQGSLKASDNYEVIFTGAILTIQPNMPLQTIYNIYIKESDNGEVISTMIKAAAGDRVGLVARPNKDYYLASLSIKKTTGGEVALGISSESSIYFLMPASDVVVIATFEKTEGDQNIFIRKAKYGEIISHVLHADPDQQVNLRVLHEEDSELDFEKLVVINNKGERLDIFSIQDPKEGTIYYFFMNGESVDIFSSFKGTNNVVDESNPLAPDNLFYLLNNDYLSFLNLSNGAEGVQLAMSLVANILAKFTPEGELNVRLGEDDVAMTLLNLKSGWQIKFDFTGDIKVLVPGLLEGLGADGTIETGVLYKMLGDGNLEFLLKSSMMPLLIKSITIIAPEPEPEPPTAISSLQADDGAVDTYDLRGRKVDPTSLRKGVYIRNGKKIMIHE